MALETLKGITRIGGFEVMQERPKNEDGSVDWERFDELRKVQPIFVDHDVNMISFRIQNGPIREVGINGCQVDTLIEAAKTIIEKLNEKYPCQENEVAISHLRYALQALAQRTANRMRRGVEGTSQE